MKKEHLHHDVRKARIYKDIYRSSSKPSRFFGTLLAIILQGQSPVSATSLYAFRRKS
ncbi:MAG TPA: hypothetical protein VNW04_06745 [Puia sp.]|jgi:hypothetical protein|nr:hypothetical protein [Puia sp.]